MNWKQKHQNPGMNGMESMHSRVSKVWTEKLGTEPLTRWEDGQELMAGLMRTLMPWAGPVFPRASIGRMIFSTSLTHMCPDVWTRFGSLLISPLKSWNSSSLPCSLGSHRPSWTHLHLDRKRATFFPGKNPNLILWDNFHMSPISPFLGCFFTEGFSPWTILFPDSPGHCN